MSSVPSMSERSPVCVRRAEPPLDTTTASPSAEPATTRIALRSNTMPVQPDFEIEARIPDADDRSVPNWSDLTLVITQEGMGARRLDLTRGAGEAVADAIHGVLHPWAG